MEASYNLAVLIDGRLAGIAGYSSGSLSMPFERGFQDAVILSYAVGTPHQLRLTRLVTMIAALRSTVDLLIVNKWLAMRAGSIVTVEYTKHPEAKGLRNTSFRLWARKPHPLYTQQLTYHSPLQEGTPQDVLAQWLVIERRWQKSRSAA
jgi:hypothetical protein